MSESYALYFKTPSESYIKHLSVVRNILINLGSLNRKKQPHPTSLNRISQGICIENTAINLPQLDMGTYLLVELYTKNLPHLILN